MGHKTNKAKVSGSLTFRSPGNVSLVVRSVKFIKIEYLCIFLYSSPPKPRKLYASQTHFWIHNTPPCLSNSMAISFVSKKTWSQLNKLFLDPSLLILFWMFKKMMIPDKYHNLLKNKEFNSVLGLLSVWNFFSRYPKYTLLLHHFMLCIVQMLFHGDPP